MLPKIEGKMKNSELLKLVQEHFSEVAQDYSASSNEEFYRNIAETLCGELSGRGISPSKILEIGSGTGAATEVLLRDFPDAFIDCHETSQSMVSAFRQKEFDQSRVRILEKDRIQDTYDLVLSSMTLHWIDDLLECLTDLISKLAPGGVAVFSVPVKGVRFQEAGNLMIYETFTELKKRNIQILRGKQWRGLSIEKLKKDLKEYDLNIKTRTVVEKIDTKKFVDTLYVRGVLLALFGDQQLLAADIMQKKIERGAGLADAKKFVNTDQPAINAGQTKIDTGRPTFDLEKSTINYAWPIAFGLVKK